ncbi:MAG: glycosyltransferase family 4 protein [Desulfuromonadaceae bacterium]|jgi:glycosyltransferase involved in cell wall biosynthesis
MKILLSAYACEPNRGSEPGVGWNWALELAKRGHEVWVLTRANNREPIEAELAAMVPLENLHFLYFDLPEWCRRLKKFKGGIYPYYLAWQWGAYKMAHKVHRQIRFDRVHHVTFVSIRLPSFMGGLGIPFVFGPVAGGEYAPWRLRRGYPARGWILDALRDLANALVRIDPLMRRTFRRAERIFVTSEQTLDLVPNRYRSKTRVQLAIGLDEKWLQAIPPSIDKKPAGKEALRLLYVGRFLYWKGMHLGLPAFARFLEKCPAAVLTMIGQGPEEKLWRELAAKLGIAHSVRWVSWVDQAELSRYYREHDLFYFPSLHDSGGMVVLEALAHGVPVLCFDLGGPGTVVNETCALVAETKKVSENVLVADLADKLLSLWRSPELLSSLAGRAKDRAYAFNWEQLVTRIYPQE